MSPATSLHIDSTAMVQTIAAAFRADPAARWMYPDDAQFDAYFPRFIRAFGGAAFARKTALSLPGAAALWLPPGSAPDEAAIMDIIQESVTTAQIDRVFAVLEVMGEAHPTEPHWYLPLIGVEPQQQGRGLGTALMREGLELCDREGLPAYLEATNPQNTTLYQRLGFEVVQVIQTQGCPPITTMLRRNRKSAPPLMGNRR